MPSCDEIEAEILRLIQDRGVGKTICPSQVARSFSQDETAWRALMPSVREAAGRLAERGEIQVTQRGELVDIDRAKGPVRLGLRC